MATVVPADAHLYVAELLHKAIASVSNLSGFTIGTRLAPGVTPDRYIRYEVVGSDEVSRLGERVNVRIQVWLNGPASERRSVARIILAHLRARMGRKTSGPVDLPDPVDPARELTQFTISVLLIGAQA